MTPGKDNDALCPCGSGQYAYNLFDHKKQFVGLFCFKCEKTRRNGVDDADVQQSGEIGEMLAKVLAAT